MCECVRVCTLARTHARARTSGRRGDGSFLNNRGPLGCGHVQRKAPLGPPEVGAAAVVLPVEGAWLEPCPLLLMSCSAEGMPW